MAICYILVLLTLSACTSAPCSADRRMVETQLYFGMNKPYGTVSDKEWRAFVAHEIAPRFTEGFTVVNARGVWLDASHRPVSENSKILIRIHVAKSAEDKKIDEIVVGYKRAFAQESVLRVDTPICAQF